MPTLAETPSRAIVDHLTTRLSTYWEEPPEVRAELLVGLPDLVNRLNRAIDDGYEGLATATDSPAPLLRQLAHALRRLS